jgi:hypothetical protein
MSTLLSSALLFFCWIAALATLLVFLESWFTVSSHKGFVARRASGAYGVLSVFLPMRGPVVKTERTIRSVFGQSYPFLELFLIHSEDDTRHANLAHEFQSMRSHIPVRVVTTPHSIETAHDRTRALEQVQGAARGRWYVVLDSDVVLDRLAVEASLEFAGSGEVSALALRPGVQCRSFLHRLLAPSMEYFFQTIRVVERRRERAKKMSLDASFLLLNREAFEVVNRINRMPGILNESGWNVWSYQVEGLRTFEGDGSRWMWREVNVGSWSAYSETERRYTTRSAGFVLASALLSLIPLAGLIYGFSVPVNTFLGASVLAFSAMSYSLMAISYFLYARRLHGAGWFAPLWFAAHIPASLLAVMEIRRSVAGRAGTSTKNARSQTAPTVKE